MILEVANLTIISGQEDGFEKAFRLASKIISRMTGYVSHELQRCIEHDNQYVLLVWWQTLADHEIGFRQSAEYQEWKKLLHNFYDPFPTVLHYQAVMI
jgi:heme-degrading monooxygenase HmoA